MIIIEIFLNFLKIGAFSFGGGYAMLPFIEDSVVVANQWVTTQEFSTILGISQITPGPISINLATYIGFKTGGILAAIAGAVGVIAFSFVLVTLACKYINRFKENKYISSIMFWLKPAIVALVINSCVSLSLGNYINIKSTLIGLLAFFMLYKVKIHPILVIFMGALIGLL